MLTAQAAEAIEAFIGKPVAPKSILRMTAELAREKMNLVLIGMPGCGKSTIARKLAEISGRPAVDIDQRIVERIGMPIRDFFGPQSGSAGNRSEPAAELQPRSPAAAL